MTTTEFVQHQNAQLDATLSQLESFGDSRAQKIPAAPVYHYIGSSVYKGDAVLTVRALEEEVLKTFSGPQYAGVSYDLVRAVRQDWESRLHEESPKGTLSTVNRAELLNVLHQLLDLVRGVLSKPENRVSISIHTNPQAAIFTLCPQYPAGTALDSDGCFSITTDGDLPGLFRGLYPFTIQLAGYKTAHFNIDLVHFSQKQLRCVLHAAASNNLAGPCTPQ